jgi:hypothetical protein
MVDTTISLGPCADFVAWQAAQQAESLSREQEGEAYYSSSAPLGLRFDAWAEAIATWGGLIPPSG